MTKADMPPALAFWSLTLYDAKEGFFIPNKEKKYSVGENAGMKLNASGGIEVYVAAKQPKGVPAEELAADDPRGSGPGCHHARLPARPEEDEDLEGAES